MPEITKDGMALLTAWQEVACKAVEAIRSNAIGLDEASRQSFQQAASEVLVFLKSDPSSPATPASAAAAFPPLEDYLRDSKTFSDGAIAELREIVNRLMATVTEVHKECEEAEAILHRIHERIDQTNSVEELQAAKADLKQALGELRYKSARRKELTAEMQSSLQERVAVLGQFHAAKSATFAAAGASPERMKGDGASVTLENSLAVQPLSCSLEKREEFDAVTGLPSKHIFNDTVMSLPAQRAGKYVAVFYFQRLKYINARYGDSVGDEVLMFCAQLLATKILRPAEQLYRWRGPSFCAIVERKGTLADVRKDLRSRLGPRVQFVGLDGSVLLNIGVAMDVRSAEMPNTADIVQEMEKFVLLPSTRG